MTLYNESNQNLVGKIEFFQHLKKISSQDFIIKNGEKAKIKVPDKYNSWKIYIEIINKKQKETFEINDHYLYRFVVKEKISISKDEKWKIIFRRIK